MTANGSRAVLFSGFLVLVLVAAAFPGGCAATDPDEEDVNRIADASVCAVPVDNRCPTDEREFAVQSRVIFVTATVLGATPGTEARATLTRIADGSREKVRSYSISIEPVEDAGTAELVFFFDSGNGENDGEWLAGEYEVEVSVDGVETEPVRKTIHVR